MFSKFFMLILLSAFMLSCGRYSEEDERIIGVKIYDWNGSMVNLFQQWSELGINTAFSSLELLTNDEYRIRAAEQQISTFVIFPVFFNAAELSRKPELFAITAEGKPAKEEWVEFVCPSRIEYRRQIVENAKQIILEYDPDGISIDFIRHFVFWEKVYPDRDPQTLQVTCFDSTCLANFQEKSGTNIPNSLTAISERAKWILENHPDAWTEWKSSLITSMVREIAETVRAVKPEILVNVHLVPWAQNDFEGAGLKIAGQDIAALAEIADYLSPMTYAHMVKREPEWIHNIVVDFHKQSNSKILPSIQVNKGYLENELDPEEFEQSLRAALKPPSHGVVFWSWERLEEDPEKEKIVHKVCFEENKSDINHPTEQL